MKLLKAKNTILKAKVKRLKRKLETFKQEMSRVVECNPLEIHLLPNNEASVSFTRSLTEVDMYVIANSISDNLGVAACGTMILQLIRNMEDRSNKIDDVDYVNIHIVRHNRELIFKLAERLK